MTEPMPESFAMLVESSRPLGVELRRALLRVQEASAADAEHRGGRGHLLIAQWWADLAAVVRDAHRAADVLEAEARDAERALGRTADEAMLERLGITVRAMTAAEIAEAWPDTDDDVDGPRLRWPDDFPSDGVVPPGV
ncbi:MAG: hypothetical protein DCC47_16015 [Acidobacteria bacterium]|nr:MAG: hypothetical protein DCC47_16015 [Acidobacteriota bacterium]